MSRTTGYGTGNMSPNDSPLPTSEAGQVNEVETKWRSGLSLGLEPTTSPGYLGSTSYLSVFEDDNDHGASVPQEAALTKFKSSMSSNQRSALLEEGSRILKIFEWFDALEIVFTRTLQLSENMLFPPPWIMTGWLTVASRYSQMRTKPYSKERMGQEVDLIFENTFRPLNIYKSTTAEEYIEQFTGDNIRWEMVACVFITIARGAKHISKHDSIWSAPPIAGRRQVLCMQMLQFVESCLSICFKNGVINEVSLWISTVESMLISSVAGDTSYTLWTKWGGVISACYAAGLHEHVVKSSVDVPFFLGVFRRQVLANIYSLDKTVSTLLGRPPRLPKKYCTLDLPPDITSKELLMPEADIVALMQTFDEDGWAPDVIDRAPSYARLGLRAAMLREEILELSLTSLPDNAAAIAEDIARRSYQAYNLDLPPHARYDRSCWKSKSTKDCMILMMCYLNHVYNDFLLQRFLVSRLRRPPTALLRLARQMVSDILELINRHDELNLFRVDLDWILSLYALPCAGVLALELLRQTKTRTSLQDFPRSEVIQNLSVLVSCLGWAATPEDGNYHLCKEARQLLSRILDNVLSADPSEPPRPETESEETMQLGNGALDRYPENWSWFDNIDFDGDFWSQLAEHPSLHAAPMI